MTTWILGNRDRQQTRLSDVCILRKDDKGQGLRTHKAVHEEFLAPRHLGVKKKKKEKKNLMIASLVANPGMKAFVIFLTQNGQV